MRQPTYMASALSPSVTQVERISPCEMGQTTYRARPQSTGNIRTTMSLRIGRTWHALLDHYRKPRVLGLDLLRITASLSIIIHHGNAAGALGRNWLASVFGSDGYLAVDIFFVLSGWLLTRQVLRMRGAFASTAGFALTFWLRRWARTIPPYWAVLTAIFLLGPARLNPLALPHALSVRDAVVHALFLQTLLPPNLFAVTWSLVTEEWFYLLLPFVILLASRVRNWRGLIAFGVLALLLPTVVRTILLLSSADWDAITRQPVARFEGLVVGAMLAAASVTLPAWQHTVLKWRHLLFALGVPLIVVVLAAGTSDSAWFRIGGLLAFSVGIGLLMPLLSQLRWWASAPTVAVVAIAYLSELTYPLYLVHTLVPRISWVHTQGPMRLVYALGSIAILFAVASALHLGVERPFLAWRDRHPVGVRSWKEPVEASQPGRDIYPIAPPAVVPVPSV